MYWFSTEDASSKDSFEDAILNGMPSDGGLYMPEFIPKLNSSFLSNIYQYTLQEIAYEIAYAFLSDDLSKEALKKIVESALTFDAPLLSLNDNIAVCELFHGPTCAFKDFGARFMARVLEYYIKKANKILTILVATSGDTGSAVANGFYKIPGIDVIVLYPSRKISEIQEKQIAALNENITALEINGSFDDCQKLVKQAFVDKEIREKLFITSANSINIARLIPQTFYYFYAVAQFYKNSINQPKKPNIYFSVPSGNFGNLTSGIIAKMMGLPVKGFIASTNINDTVPLYLQSGRFIPKPSKQTISNAMDVGNPSNFTRILSLYKGSYPNICKDIIGLSFNDNTTRKQIKYLYDTFGYIADPHGAVASLGAFSYFNSRAAINTKTKINKNFGNYINDFQKNSFFIFLETACPAKFIEIVKPIIGRDINYPEQLLKIIGQKKTSVVMGNDFTSFKEFLLSK